MDRARELYGGVALVGRVDSTESCMVALTPDKPVPGSIQALRTVQQIDTLQAPSIASNVAVIRTRAVELGMIPSREMDHVQR